MWNYLSQFHGTSGNAGKFSRRLAYMLSYQLHTFWQKRPLQKRKMFVFVCQDGLCANRSQFINKDTARLGCSELHIAWIFRILKTGRNFVVTGVFSAHRKSNSAAITVHQLASYVAGVTNWFLFNSYEPDCSWNTLSACVYLSVFTFLRERKFDVSALLFELYMTTSVYSIYLFIYFNSCRGVVPFQ
jgi:hypothetical protein